MNRIESIFETSRASDRKLLMPFICGGRPSLEDTAQVIPALEQSGASIIEIGFPFSDPIADGPVIAQAMHHALEAGVTPQRVCDAVRSARESVNAGLVAMASVSIVERIGRDRFVGMLADAGFDGVIYPDAPLEEATPLVHAAGARGMTASLLVAPTTSIDRARKIAALCTGFVYVLARAGITGEQSMAPADDLRQRIARLREVTALPLAVGFGISSPESVAETVGVDRGNADAAIVGSALVRRMESASAGSATEVAAQFCTELATGLA